MQLLTISAITIASIIAFKLIRFFARGGTLTQPAINTTHLYYQIRKIYGNMEPECAAYIAMEINSACVRSTIQKYILRAVAIEVRSDDDWLPACAAYTLLWHKLVTKSTLIYYPKEKEIAKTKIIKSIENATNEIRNGSKRYAQWVKDMHCSIVKAATEYSAFK